MNRVQVIVSDPWDFVTPAGTNVFAADVHRRADGDGLMLLRLAEPVLSQGEKWSWFVATRTGEATDSLLGVTDVQAAGDEWMEVPKSWRGGSPAARAEISG